HDYIRKIDDLLTSIDSAIQRSSDLNKTIIKQLNKIKSSLSRYIGYKNVLQKQEITINIKPINKNLELEEISFVSSRNKQYFN
ncbi:hypothetical protein NAI59_11035, partial [Francisella tularensis subsp. holarctica]|uniref:hypothetical protein n=1 Tax=Francisella tularensis TaxID=263 RepID=UPI002381BD36